jgi:hypothetical protein
MDAKKLVVVGLGLVGFGLLFAVAAPAGGRGETKVIKSKSSGTFVSANFDFDNPNLSNPASYINGEGTGTVIGKFTNQGVNEVAPDGHHCTVLGGVANAGTEFTLVGAVYVLRITDTGDLLFFKDDSLTFCQDFTTPTLPFSATETGVVTGGTGAFSGATGTFTGTTKGATLSVDATGARIFGWFTNKFTSTVTVPDSD